MYHSVRVARRRRGGRARGGGRRREGERAATAAAARVGARARGATVTASPRRSGGGVRGLLQHLDLPLSARGSGRRSQQPPQQLNRSEPSPTSSPQRRERVGEELGDWAPPEWALLLIGCLLGLATGICVAAFNRGVHVIHEWVWAGTPNEGAAWLCLQRLADTWHRILLIPVTGGVVVGMMHGLLEIFDQLKLVKPPQKQVAFLPIQSTLNSAISLEGICLDKDS
uniref:Chloride channel protein n=1 Tax=Oryza glumipatula TaxID=40148 RepID=A0A0E0A3Q0_9ORYZ